MKRLIALLLLCGLHSMHAQLVTINEDLVDAQGNNLAGFLRISTPPYLLPVGSALTITGATNATPIEITATAHGLSTGHTVYIVGVLGNTAANGTWRITNTGANTFTLTSSVGNGAYTSGGTAQRLLPVGPSTRRHPTSGTFSGNINLTLEPTTTGIAIPGGAAAGFTHLVNYVLNDGTTFNERWNIPATPTTTTVSAVRAPGTLNPTASVALTQLADFGTDTRNSVICSDGTKWTRCLVNIASNANTATTYTVADVDRNKLVTFSNTSAVAVTLPQAGASALFLSGWYAWFRNINTGLVTITPTTSTIDGAATFTLGKSQDIMVVSDGTNYSVARGSSVLSRTSSFCSGTATSSVTLFMVLWPSGACTNTTEGVTTELLVSAAGTLRNLRVKAGTAGFAAGSGAVTLRINAVNSAVTCTVGTGTTCSNTANVATVAAGDRITAQIVTVATETLANLQIAFDY